MLVFGDYVSVYLKNIKEFTIKFGIKRNIGMLARLNHENVSSFPLYQQ